MQHDVGAAVGFFVLLHVELRITLAAPVLCWLLFPRFCENLHLVADHEGTIESESEVTDKLFVTVLVLLHEVGHAAESYLVDVLLHLVGGHADATVAHGEGLLLGINFDVDGQVAQLALEVAAG